MTSTKMYSVYINDNKLLLTLQLFFYVVYCVTVNEKFPRTWLGREEEKGRQFEI